MRGNTSGQNGNNYRTAAPQGYYYNKYYQQRYSMYVCTYCMYICYQPGVTIQYN